MLKGYAGEPVVWQESNRDFVMRADFEDHLEAARFAAYLTNSLGKRVGGGPTTILDMDIFCPPLPV